LGKDLRRRHVQPHRAAALTIAGMDDDRFGFDGQDRVIAVGLRKEEGTP
jgi:hypothetical protein